MPEKAVDRKGGNQWLADPRQQLFLAYYKDPTSETFSNAKQSAIRAGYTEVYADNIMSLLPEWLSDVIGQQNPLLVQAEKNLKEFLELPSHTPAMGAFGPVYEKIRVPDGKTKKGKPKYKTVKQKVMVHNAALLGIKQRSTEFIAETVGKKVYSKKGTGEGDVFNVVIFQNGQRTKIAKRLIRGGSTGDTDGA